MYYDVVNQQNQPLLYCFSLSQFFIFSNQIMASPCLCTSQFSLMIDSSRLGSRPAFSQRSGIALKCMNSELCGQRVPFTGSKLSTKWSFVGGSSTYATSCVGRLLTYRKSSEIYATWFASPQFANSVFTLGTAAVLPFYTLMVVAPKAELTKKSMESSIPYVVLGLLYAYLLYLSWTPDTLKLMFASKYWMPELSGMAKMFSNEMTLASAWIHLLAVDLFAARQVFNDGLENKIETRHSVSLCLLFCPIGIVIHVITRSLTKSDQPLH